MNKRDMVHEIANGANLTRVQAAAALEAFLSGVQTSLVRGDRVTISGFGTFDVLHRKARLVRNPRSGSAVQVNARRVPRFAPAPHFRTAVDR